MILIRHSALAHSHTSNKALFGQFQKCDKLDPISIAQGIWMPGRRTEDHLNVPQIPCDCSKAICGSQWQSGNWHKFFHCPKRQLREQSGGTTAIAGSIWAGLVLLQSRKDNIYCLFNLQLSRIEAHACESSQGILSTVTLPTLTRCENDGPYESKKGAYRSCPSSLVARLEIWIQHPNAIARHQDNQKYGSPEYKRPPVVAKRDIHGYKKIEILT